MGDKDVLSWPEAVGSGNCLPEVAQIKTNEGGCRFGRGGAGLQEYWGFFGRYPMHLVEQKSFRMHPVPHPPQDSRCPRYIHSRLLCMQD